MRSSSRQEVMAEINVTPLVDVMLVLLIIFMVTAPMLHQGKGFEVRLPHAETGRHVGASPLVIALTKEHLIYVDSELVTMKELRQRLARAGTKAPVMILSDRRAYVEKLIELWDLCRQAGFDEVRIATSPQS